MDSAKVAAMDGPMVETSGYEWGGPWALGLVAKTVAKRVPVLAET